jgi:hypothetical protein
VLSGSLLLHILFEIIECVGTKQMITLPKDIQEAFEVRKTNLYVSLTLERIANTFCSRPTFMIRYKNCSTSIQR